MAGPVQHHANHLRLAQSGDCAKAINESLAEGKLKACISRVMPLAEVGTAHQMVEDSQRGLLKLKGKIVLIV